MTSSKNVKRACGFIRGPAIPACLFGVPIRNIQFLGQQIRLTRGKSLYNGKRVGSIHMSRQRQGASRPVRYLSRRVALFLLLATPAAFSQPTKTKTQTINQT